MTGHASGEQLVPMPFDEPEPLPFDDPPDDDGVRPPWDEDDDAHVVAFTGGGETAGRIVPYRTPLEIAASTSEHPDWLIRGYVALGAITELDGKIKSSGKTTLILDAIRAILDGDAWLGQPTMTTKVTYLSEQTPGPFREALARANLLGRGSELRIVFRADVTAVPWRDLAATVAADARRDGYGLLVVDTLGKLASIREENDAGEGGRVMAPLQNAAHDGMAVIVCRHERKGGGDVGESGRGSSAISGDVDVILQLRRPEGNQPSSRRVIETLSRYSETPDKVVIELTDEGYVLLGDSEAVSLADAIRFVSGLLERGYDRNESGPAIEEMVAEADGALDRSAIRRALGHLERVGEIEVSGRGVKGNPKRYRLRQIDSGLSNGLIDRNGIEADR